MLQNLHRTSTHPPPVKFARRARKIARRGKKIPLCAIFLVRRANDRYQLNLLLSLVISCKLLLLNSKITAFEYKFIAFEEDLGLKMIQN